MPHKIGFVVVSSSGHEDGFSARELMIHAPTVSGWRSPRFCQFPQEIVLQMVERCRIRKLQLLAHQYMISSKIEFYISESLPEYFAPYQAERFRRLGYVSLCDNEKTGCKARELKSVYVDAVGQFLKLIFHQNHVNKYNIYNQVALVAINIIGDPADFSDESNTASREKLIDHYLGHNSEDPALEGTYASSVRTGGESTLGELKGPAVPSSVTLSVLDTSLGQWLPCHLPAVDDNEGTPFQRCLV
ncbi:CEP104 isoform 11 [Pan troglodytes]|uniref:CEP104 isoform 11 n=2 Tax=Pan troglodytes TaxID=9598 RepID=A0A6D2YBZ8_PANTR|nr:CEP104 isoform 11 [Pan troglodytes]